MMLLLHCMNPVWVRCERRCRPGKFANSGIQFLTEQNRARRRQIRRSELEAADLSVLVPLPSGTDQSLRCRVVDHAHQRQWPGPLWRTVAIYCDLARYLPAIDAAMVHAFAHRRRMATSEPDGRGIAVSKFAHAFEQLPKQIFYRLLRQRVRLPMSVDSTEVPNVLVVEDEMLLRMRAVDIVEDAGFRSVEAVNADEALSILESRSDISLLFTDIQMPGSMDGLKLAH